MEVNKLEEDEVFEEEYAPLEIPPEFRHIEARTTKRTVRDLWSRMLSGEIEYEPGFQRHYVWDDAKASRFIESLILGMPVPPIFLAEEENKWVVVDGHQRLETILRFLQPILTKEKKDRDVFTKTVYPTKKERGGAVRYIALVLKKLEVLPELNGKKATDIEGEIMKKFWDYEVPVVEIPRSVHPDLKYALFVRLNQGSMVLNHQELRNCLYRGAYNDLIRDLAEDPKFLEAFGKRYPDKRMRDRERVLAFFAFAHRLEVYQPPRHRFLNQEMEANREIEKEQIEEYREEFWRSLEWTMKVFGSEAFRLFYAGNEDNPDGSWSKRRMDMVFEVEMVGFQRYGERLDQLFSSLKRTERDDFLTGLRHKLVGVMVNPDFKETLERQTSNSHIVERRFRLWNEALEEAIDDWEGTIERTRLLLDLQRKSTACWHCPKHITSLDDAEVIEEGGEYRLIHRCHII
jgi:hypothetical protein